MPIQVQHQVSRAVMRAAVSGQLRQYYNGAIAHPIPEKFRNVLDALSEAGKQAPDVDGHPQRKWADPPSEFRDGLLALIPELRSFAIALVGRADRADDLVQETVTKAWKHYATFVIGTNLKAWLHTILRNEFYTQLRRRGREVPDSDGQIATQILIPAEQDAHADLEDVKAVLLQLPADKREALLLVGVFGLSYEEAAAVCQVPSGTIKSRVSRARNQLESRLGLASSTEQAEIKAVAETGKR